MKITILLCALASLCTLAAAVPTNLHQNLQEHGYAVDDLSDTTLREKKSPLHEHHADAEAETTSSSAHKSSTMEGRHFKKPIIVKKKIGYHVYRDSDEEMEHSDPHEKCREQVKVKLCDDEPGSPKSIGSCKTDLLNEEKEIENSIKTAKEAVENLQRGFHKIEHHTGKLANTEDKEFEDHVAVHQHIEAARKALEQVQQNFGHLDALHSKPSEEERLAQWKEAMDNIQKNFEIARNIEDGFKTESELTHLQSIPPLQQLDEPVKIRESEHTETKVDSEQNKEELMSNQSNGLQKQRENSEVEMYAAPTEQNELKIKLHSDSLKTEKVSDESVVDHETKAKNTEQIIDHVPTMKNSEITPMIGESMKTEGAMSAKPQETTAKVHQHESKAANDIDMEKENLKTLESNTQDKTFVTEKSSVSKIEDMKPFVKGKSNDNQLNLVKSAQEESLDQTMKLHDMSVGSSNIVNQQSHLEMKHTLNNEDDKLANKDTIVTKTSITDGQMFDHPMKTKAVQDIDEHHKHFERMNGPLQGKEVNMPAQMQMDAINNMRSSQQSHIESTPTTGFNNGQQITNTHPLMRTIEGQSMAHLEETPDFHNLNDHSVMQMADDQEKLHAFLMRWAHENQQIIPELTLSEDLMRSAKMGELNGQHIHNEQMGMRSGQDLNTGHHLSENNEHDPLFMQWAQENNQHQSMRNPIMEGQNLNELFMTRFAQEKQQQDHLKTAPEFHNGHLHETLTQNKFAMANTQDLSQHGPRMHEHLHIMKHAMPSDMDSAMQPSMHMSMRDAMGKPGFDHNDMHWNHHHHAMARYGSGSGLPISGIGGGAVGLFPNANTGGCGIPLMLSCSPSVVSGTLAKAQTHPTAITAPAYRSGDDLMYYMKRDAKDSEDLPALKIQKSSIPFTHKPELIYDKSQ